LKHSAAVSVLALVLISLFVAACGASGSSSPKPAAGSALPAKMQSAPVRVREAYQFAVANPDALKNVPCYCGCGAMGHTSNYSCYVKEAKPDGALVFDDHALGCSICVDIAQDVKRLSAEGKTPAQVRSFVVDTYSRFGPPNQ
jgi:hypothetical protein